MKATCPACGKSVDPAPFGSDGASACPECGAVLPSAAAAAPAPAAGAPPESLRPPRPAAPEPKARGTPSARARGSVHAVRRLEVGEVFAQSVSAWVRNLFTFLLASVVVFLPLILYTAVHAGIDLEGTPPSKLLEAARTYDAVQTWGGAVLGYLLTAAIISGVFQYLRGSPPGLGEIFARGFARMLPALWTGILVTLASVLPIALAGAALFGLMESRRASGAGLGLVVVLVGAVLSIMIAASLYAAVAASVVEKCNGFPAIKRSLALTKGSRGTIFVILLAVWVLIFLGGFLVQRSGGYATIVVLGQVLRVLSASFTAVFAAVIYYRLRASREGIGIEELAKVFD